MLTLYIKYNTAITKKNSPISGDNSNPFGLAGWIICRHMARFPQHCKLFNIITCLVDEVFALSNFPFNFHPISANSFLKFKEDKRPCLLCVNSGPFLVNLGLRGSTTPPAPPPVHLPYLTSLVALCFTFLWSFFPLFEYEFKSPPFPCSKKSTKEWKIGLEGWTKRARQEWWGSSAFI